MTPPVERHINGQLFIFCKHSHMGIAYYNVESENHQVTIIPSQGSWTFLHPEEVHKDLIEIKSDLIAIVESLEKERF